jgi:hypothetical protein
MADAPSRERRRCLPPHIGTWVTPTTVSSCEGGRGEHLA